jgi:lactate dehydrogenase-like 2-hydroxyacid dehydrogenase
MISVNKPVALQMCGFSEYMEAQLAQRFEVVRWFELAPEARVAWLADGAARVHAVVTGGHVGCDNTLMAALPMLGIISINGVGVDKVDLPYAAARGVRVTTTPGVLTDDVADLAVGLVISLLRGITGSDAYVRAGRWPQGEWPLARKVTGRRFGIMGLGHIGSAIATRLAAFGSIAYCGPSRKPVRHEYYADPLALASNCNVLILACPATAQTRHLVNAEVLRALGPEGYLVNVARGSVVDEAALVAALECGELAGAALDVYEREPHVPEALRADPRVVLTPHVASATIEGRRAMADLLLANLDAFLAGQPLPSMRI